LDDILSPSRGLERILRKKASDGMMSPGQNSVADLLKALNLDYSFGFQQYLAPILRVDVGADRRVQNVALYNAMMQGLAKNDG
jgi:hypothetical protein